MSTYTLDQIPLEPEQISREWLFHVINQYRSSRDLSQIKHPNDIIDCSIDECENSHGYLSTTYKLVAHFTCPTFSGIEECSYAFFLKMMPGVEKKHLSITKQTKVFEREVKANFSVIPMMTSFAKDHVKNKEGFDFNFPQIVYGSYDETGAGILLSMDLNDDGYYPINHYTGFTVPQLLRVVEKLAEFHALGSAMIIQDSQSIEKMESLKKEEPNKTFLQEFLNPLYKDFSRFLRRVPGFLYCLSKLEKLKNVYIEMIISSTEKPSNFPMNTILHGELWEQNILLRFEQISANLEVIFCDWKNIRIGSPIEDLVFLMMTCTSKSLRTTYYKQILENYFVTYARSLAKFGIDFVALNPNYQLADLYSEFQNSLGNFLFQVVFIMTREIKYLEVEFYNAKEEHKIVAIGASLRALGRRLLDIVEEFLPLVDATLIRNENNMKITTKTTTKANDNMRNGKVKSRA